MGIFDEQIAFLDTIEAKLFSTMRNALRSNGIDLEEAISKDQLYDRGVDGNNKPLRNKKTGRLGYKRTTIRIKIAKGQPVDRITLRDENKFHPSITIEANDAFFIISSNVTHAKHLINNYGEDILRPTTENMLKFFNTHVLPNLKRFINERTTG